MNDKTLVFIALVLIALCFAAARGATHIANNDDSKIMNYCDTTTDC